MQNVIKTMECLFYDAIANLNSLIARCNIEGDDREYSIHHGGVTRYHRCDGTQGQEMGPILLTGHVQVPA